ncbi:MAG: chemotaxis protein CheD [Chloroflexi bacterium]|nr:chemotaxis protein CheD [Chloroflexota bacterium]MBU1747263.1 chemotaxis protein CheD [Chloroflexota bacterium]
MSAPVEAYRAASDRTSLASPADRVMVGIGELVVTRPPTRLVALGLGSCVALVLHDPTVPIGGLAHVMLPTNPQPHERPGSPKFADCALTGLVEWMLREGARREYLIAKLVGGASMFASTRAASIGQRNLMVLRRLLRQQNIPLPAVDVGGQWGRSIEFDPQTGCVRVRSFQRSERVI